MREPTAGSAKAQWRDWAKAQRDALGPQLPSFSEAVCAHLAGFLRAQNAVTVLAYRALSGELDVSALQPHFRLLTTRAHFRARRLSLHPWESATECGPLGLWQPPPGTPEVPLSEVDAALLPALAFDRSGVRLGYGGGFYDRLLAGWDGLSVGVILSALWLPRLPAEPHDIRALYVATERGVKACVGPGLDTLSQAPYTN